MRPPGAVQADDAAAVVRWRAALWGYRWFLALVVAPTLIVAGYYYLVVSDQYESRTDFVVRRAGSGGRASGGVGQILGFSLGATEAQSEARIIEEYLLSQDAVARLRKEDGLVHRFRRDGVDPLSRLTDPDPTPEDLLKYYRKHVSVELDTDKGISTLSVKAFAPDDAFHLAQKLLEMGEQRVNAINIRTAQDELSAARTELAAAQADMATVQGELTAFRRTNGDIDPAGSGKAQIGLVSELTGRLAEARAKRNAAAAFISPSSPQMRALDSQVMALEAQVAGQDARLAGAAQPQTIANRLGSYEDLQVRQDFAGKRYIAAAAAYEQAQAEARKQQLYLIRVVEPNRPVEALFPERGRIVMTTFFALAIAYAIGWLLVAGVKEHSLA